MIESQSESPSRGALPSPHCEERMAPKQSRIKIPGGEENAAWPGHKKAVPNVVRGFSLVHERHGTTLKGRATKWAACNEAGLKMGLLNENVSNASSLEWSTSGESENKLDIYKGGN